MWNRINGRIALCRKSSASWRATRKSVAERQHPRDWRTSRIATIQAKRNQRCALAQPVLVKVDMIRFLVVVLLADLLRAQTPVPEAKDQLGRNTPQDSVFHFLEACHARDYSKALRYLDLRKIAPSDRAKEGPELARQLEDLLDDTPFDIT